MGPSNHILDGDQHQTNPFAAARGDKSAIRPHTAFSQITMDICCVFLVRLCGKPFGCIAAQHPCCVTFGCNSCCRFFVCSVVHCVVACSAVCMRGVCVCVCEFVITASVGGNKMTKNCRRSRIEVRPTALLRYHAHKPWTLTFDLKPMTLTFNPRRVMALTHSVGFCVWVPYTKPQVYKGQSL